MDNSCIVLKAQYLINFDTLANRKNTNEISLYLILTSKTSMARYLWLTVRKQTNMECILCHCQVLNQEKNWAQGNYVNGAKSSPIGSYHKYHHRNSQKKNDNNVTNCKSNSSTNKNTTYKP